MTKKDKKAIEEAFIRISAKDPHCSSCIFRTEWEHIGKLLRNILENNQPSRRKGHWKREVDFGNCLHYVCSECENEGENSDYCPYCGAIMDEKEGKE